MKRALITLGCWLLGLALLFVAVTAVTMSEYAIAAGFAVVAVVLILAAPEGSKDSTTGGGKRSKKHAEHSYMPW